VKAPERPSRPEPPGGPASLSIAVVIETVNEESGAQSTLERVLDGLARQSHPAEKLELIVVVEGTNRSLGERLRERHPRVRVVESESETYYGMKTAGIQVARADVIALLDSDCIPVPVWAERMAQRISAGADVVAGKTRYPPDAPFSRAFDFFNFGYIQGDAGGAANGFLPNNVGFRREVILKHGFDPRIRRSGAAHLLGHELMALGYRLVYEPAQRVCHSSYGIGEELRMRVKSGYDSVALARIDDGEVLGESGYLRRSGLFLPIIFARRVWFDVRTVMTNRADLDVPLTRIPYLLLLSPLVRGVELAAGLITLVKSEYLKDKYRW